MTKNKSYKIFENICNVDISEQDIYDYSPEVLAALLEDHTMSTYVQENSKESSKVANIFWATFDYESTIIDENGIFINDGYQYNDEIKIEKITGLCKRVIMPRVLKTKQLQIDRTKDKAEVFTPSWVCNAQNNLIDTAWFGRKDVFNREVISENGTHYWIPTEGKIVFPDNDPKKTWTKYIVENRMEITCGEAPYLVSRYDTTTGVFIPIQKRIGLLDRKFRVINENVKTEKDWYNMAEKAIKHTYGFEWQGDNLLLAREALLYTYIEYYMDKFNKKDETGKYIKDAKGELRVPTKQKIINAARWISWNLWQMDGLKFVIPETCKKVKVCINQKEIDQAINDPFRQMFPEEAIPVPEPKYELQECPGCVSGDHMKHTGIYAIIRDWSIYENGHKDKNGKTGKERCDIRFIDIVNKNRVNKKI